MGGEDLRGDGPHPAHHRLESEPPLPKAVRLVLFRPEKFFERLDGFGQLEWADGDLQRTR